MNCFRYSEAMPLSIELHLDSIALLVHRVNFTMIKYFNQKFCREYCCRITAMGLHVARLKSEAAANSLATSNSFGMLAGQIISCC